MVPFEFIIAISIDRGIEFAGVFHIESKSHTISSLNSPGEYLCTCKTHVVNFLETTCMRTQQQLISLLTTYTRDFPKYILSHD